jgi:FkbM family methyltransferase
MKKTFKSRLIKAWNNPNEVLIKALQGWINSLRGYSYDFEKNGEKAMLEKLQKLDIKTVFDVGSNIGDWSMVASGLFPKAEIHAFELSPRTFITLKSNLKNTNVILNNFGMADFDGDIDFKDYGENSPVNTILKDASYHDHKIQPIISKAKLISGNTYCKERNIESIDILKIDVEGVDHLVLKGFSNLLSNKNIRLIQFEYGYTHGDAKFLMRDFYKLFNEYGYAIGRLTKKGVSFEPWNYKMNDFKSGPNYIAVKKDDAEIIKFLGKS